MQTVQGRRGGQRMPHCGVGSPEMWKMVTRRLRVKALGGTLRTVADFGDETYVFGASIRCTR